MRLYNVFLVAVAALITATHGLPTAAVNEQAQLSTMAARDSASIIRSLVESDGDNAKQVAGC
ncbi:hypothetical protein JG687_00012337 [Phytophthora cactorum]|uniref:RxLR effector protein n=1 Tax=Phytophthora cactorum TaxID=29920 RepID=A0A8T1U6R5_9STRA|nr:hypothetical protein JG687_00012337 [Phytophthora cactorum]